MKQKAETVEKPVCPCFSEYMSEPRRGSCSLIRYPRQDGFWPGSCLYHGDTESCLRDGDSEIRSKLKTIIEKRVRKMETNIEGLKKQVFVLNQKTNGFL
jgi:hypothetical protein